MSYLIVVGGVWLLCLIRNTIKNSKKTIRAAFLESRNAELETRLKWYLLYVDTKITEGINAHMQVIRQEPMMEYFEIDEEQEEVEQVFRKPIMRDLEVSGAPDNEFLIRLNLKQEQEQQQREELRSVLVEEDPSAMEQVEFDLEVDEKTIPWGWGTHRHEFMIVEHYGDTVSCRALDCSKTAVLQHPKLTQLNEGDTFIAFIQVGAYGKVVQFIGAS